MNQYLATDKQPKEIQTTKTYLEDLMKVANHPAMTHSFIDQLNQKVLHHITICDGDLSIVWN